MLEHVMVEAPALVGKKKENISRAVAPSITAAENPKESISLIQEELFFLNAQSFMKLLALLQPAVYLCMCTMTFFFFF